jgi:two-component system alkaline phosphatase synthesis response regulator PhoP
MIYYVEDDANIRELALYALRQSGLEARGFGTASDFSAALRVRMPQVILLDIMLPEMDGLQILKRLRADPSTTSIPVMMITAKGSEYDTVSGLDAGADDYLAKPFGMMELVSRVNALIRRAGMPAAQERAALICGDIVLSPDAHTAQIHDVSLSLTLKEFDLLRELMEHAGCVLTRDQLLQDVWSISYAGGTRTVDVHIQTLRSKLDEAYTGGGDAIRTVRGVGYRMGDGIR